MAAFTLSANSNIDSLTSKAGGDTYDTNGFTLTIDQDSRVGLEQTTSTSLGSITINATKGGDVNIDGSAIWMIPYSSGTGNVPAWNTAITDGGAGGGTGKLIGVHSSLTAASTATGAAMPATGFIRVKQKSGAYTANALGGISATADDAGRVGWLEIVGDEGGLINANRLGDFNITGAWYAVGTTNGSSNQTMQIPNNGLLRYVAGVFIEKTAGQADYEFYPNAGATTTTGTEATRGKVVWIDNTGLVRIGNSGAATNGYTPVTGLAVVVGNIFLENCTTATRTANVYPHGTVGNRYEFNTVGGGVVNGDKFNAGWYFNLIQSYSIALSNCGVIDVIRLVECATPITWTKVGVGNKTDSVLSRDALYLNLCFAGGTLTDCVWARVSHASVDNTTTLMQDCSDFNFVRNTFRCNTIRANPSTHSIWGIRCANFVFTDTVIVQGTGYFTESRNVTYTNTTYADNVSGTTVTTYIMYVWSLALGCDDFMFDGLAIPIANTHPYTALIALAAAGGTFAGVSNVKIRNFGTYATPLSLGSTNKCEKVVRLGDSGGISGVKIQRVYVTGTRTGGGLLTADNAANNVTCENVFTPYGDTLAVAPVLNFVLKGYGATPALTEGTAVYGTHWIDNFTSTTAGRLVIMMNEPTALTTAQVALTGGAAFTSAGGLYMPTIGQTATFTVPDYIIGHTAFQNSALIMAGGTATNYTYRYQIDTGSGFGSWSASKTATTLGTALNGETLDAVVGFKLKLEITTDSTNTSAITSVYMLTSSTTTTQAYQYPLEVVPVKVTVRSATTLAVIEGARVHLLADTGGPASPGAVILSGLTDASGICQTLSYAYAGDQPMIGKVRKTSASPLYKTAVASGVVASTGLDITVYCVPDE